MKAELETLRELKLLNGDYQQSEARLLEMEQREAELEARY